MATTTRSPLTEQAEKLQNLARQLSDGRLLEPVLRMAQTGDVWSGPIHQGFLSWMQFAVDGWVRNQLAQGVRLVAESLANRAAEIERAAQAAVASGGQIAMAPPAPPAPLNYSPGRPPEFGDIGGKAANNKFNNERMKELARLLETTADGAVMDFARNLRNALEPPPAPPPPPGAPPFTSPLPPDAAVAAGDPGGSSPGANAYLALADELHKAADDIERRVRQLSVLDEPLPTATVDSSLIDNVRAGAAAGAESSSRAASGGFIGPPAPRRPDELEKVRKDAEATATEAGKILSDKNFDRKDEEKLKDVLEEADLHADDPDYALAFMERFIPDGLAAWCRLASKNVINVDIQMPLLRPMSNVFATATRRGDFPPEMRKALLNSPCLDTVVHYGTFDKEFALEAARKILKDPDHYERVDGSDRVYGGLDQKGNYESGNARVGALRLLANNPEAAQAILEQHGEEGRRLIFDALRDSGMAGKEAAAVIVAGLHDLDRKGSEDTLELLIKDAAEGRLKLHDYGKQAMARILSSKEGMERLHKSATHDLTEADKDFLTGDPGFKVPAATLEKFMGKMLDDEYAQDAFLRGKGEYDALLMKQRVQEVGARQINEDIDVALTGVFNAIRVSSELNQLIADGVKEASGEKEANAFLASGINVFIGEAVKLVPGGTVASFVVEKSWAVAGSELIDTALTAEQKNRIKKLDHEDMVKELNRTERYLAQMALLGDRGLTTQLIPEGSPLWKWDKNGDGQLELPTPPLGTAPASDDWREFSEAIELERNRQPPSRIGVALMELDLWAEAQKA